MAGTSNLRRPSRGQTGGENAGGDFGMEASG
jgi:hypothetical protein